MGRVLRSKAVNENSAPKSCKKQVKDPQTRSCRKVLSDQTNVKEKMDEEKDFKGFDVPPLATTRKKVQTSIRRYLGEKQETVPPKTPKSTPVSQRPLRSSKSPKVTDKVPDETPHVPVYKKPTNARKKSSTKNPDMLYDFQVDENEPKVKGKRKKILKMKLVRHKKAHVKVPKELPPLPGFEEEERCIRTQRQEVIVTEAQVHPEPPEEDYETHEESHITELEVSGHPSLNLSSHSLQPRKTIPKKTTDNHIPILYNSFEVPNTSYADTSLNTTLLVPASTPVKYNSLSSSANFQSHLDMNGSTFNASNCFGFDEPEDIEAPLISPIKDPFIPSYTPEKKMNPKETSPAKAVSVKNVIKLLRFDTKTDRTSSQSPTQDENKIFNEKSLDRSREMSPGPVEAQFKKAPRRSYERRFKKRFDLSFEESSEDEEPVVSKKTKPKKKNQGASKKQEMELEKWAAAFNSQCMEVEQFDLCIE